MPRHERQAALYYLSHWNHGRTTKLHDKCLNRYCLRNQPGSPGAARGSRHQEIVILLPHEDLAQRAGYAMMDGNLASLQGDATE